jgi:transposase-like protein
MTMPTLTSVSSRAHDGVVADDEPRDDRPRRRSYSPDYKLAILAEYDRCSGDGDKGALLRREGLYSSHIVEWRRAREAGTLNPTGSTAAKSKRQAKTDAAALAKAHRRAERLEAELARTKAALEIMGKAHALLGMLAESADSEPKPKKS